MECVVCLNGFDEQSRPVTGTCGHSVCSQCAPSLPRRDCPSCRKDNAFSQPITNYLASELHEQLTNNALSLERRGTVIIDLQSRLDTMDQDLNRERVKADGMTLNDIDEWEVIPELGKLQQENSQLKRDNLELKEKINNCAKTVENYKHQLDKALEEQRLLKAKNDQLKSEQDGFLRREAENERRLKERNDWDMLEDSDYENVPRPENVIMILPTMKLLSDDTKKQLTDLGIVLIQRADLTSRQLYAASKKQYHETVVPLMNRLAEKTAEMIVNAQRKN